MRTRGRFFAEKAEEGRRRAGEAGGSGVRAGGPGSSAEERAATERALTNVLVAICIGQSAVAIDAAVWRG
jgi:hypothetical protein